ncbi:histidine phosphatase family protein [Roseobacter sp. HKCCD7870]|uniref:histidine phosphatase family protein n=1 Tax=Roseobacter sp. HKCCD7870 TaxID=3120343 RepID=UPI0030EF2289
MRRAFWLRHGPTHAKVITGWRDVPADLSDHAQIARLDAYLPAQAVMISSDLIRAAATADALSPRLRLPHERHLREFHFGEWEGQGFDAVSQSAPELSRAFWEGGEDICPPNGESWAMVMARVSRASDRVLGQHPDQDVIFTCHFGAILTQIARHSGLSAYQAYAHTIPPLSVTEFHQREGRWSVVRIGYCP